MKKNFNLFVLIASAFLLSEVQVAANGNNSKRPNIILMMADDMGWGDTGFNGNKIIRTPNLDKLASEGMVLNHFYSIGPVCSPTRASLLTGRHYYRMGVWTANAGHLPAEEFTIARLLKGTGYTTGHFGKWHLGTLSKESSSKGQARNPEVHFAPPWFRDYDESFVTESAVCTWNPGIGPRAKNNPYYHNGIPVTDPVKDNVMGDDSRVIMDRVIPFIREAVNNDNPFVAVVWFHAPHEDVQAGPEYLKMYEGHGEAAHFYGCITAMDEQVGRLRAELEQLGIDGNTALFFCSDNGPEGPEPKDRMLTRRAGSAGEFRGRKRDVTEGGVRVPALAFWPGVTKPGTHCDVPLSVMDYLPTIAAAIDEDLLKNRPIDGQDIMPILRQKENIHSKSIPFRYDNKKGSFACLVKGNYKLIIESGSNPAKDQLYDLSADLQESVNIAAQNQLIVAEMRNEALRFLDSAKDSHSGADYDDNSFNPVDQWKELGKSDGNLD